jgi:hypothetical protein
MADVSQDKRGTSGWCTVPGDRSEHEIVEGAFPNLNISPRRMQQPESRRDRTPREMQNRLKSLLIVTVLLCSWTTRNIVFEKPRLEGMHVFKINRLCLFFLLTTATLAVAHDSGQFKANLIGYSEVPAVWTKGSGQVTVATSTGQTTWNVTQSITSLLGVAQPAGLYLGLPVTTGGALAPICGGTRPAGPTTANGTSPSISGARFGSAPLRRLKASGTLCPGLYAQDSTPKILRPRFYAQDSTPKTLRTTRHEHCTV